ncbi:hypothetical protein ACPPVU_06450 [Mucilaginibacter sp. McL0603]|uniref:hypothetical protein n=1 Tax=Mucilaginibacter sp. McL0603 TaxID=3415670 RepID=UPI003CF12CF1
MKPTFYILFIAAFFLSCRSNPKQTAKDTTTNIKPTADQTQELIKKFRPIIQGVWVKKDYIDKVIKTKSPLAAIDECRGITIMYINTDHIKGDSLQFIAGYFNHDSGNVTIQFKPGKNPSTILFNNEDLSYSIENGDTTITVFQYDNQKKLIVKAKFIKALNRQSDDDLGYGMNYMIDKGIFSGNYILTDSTGSVSKISFTNDGKVSGFLNFSEYNINIDLNNDAMDNLDMIFFRDKKKTADNNFHGDYSFKLNSDTLSLFDTHPNVDSSELILGKRIYKLVKQK